MSIEKFKTNAGQTRWRVRFYLNGRGSKRVKKVFTSKSEALDFEFSLSKERKDKLRFGPERSLLENSSLSEEAQFWLSVKSTEFSPSHLKRVRGILNEILPLVGELDPKHLHSEALYDLRKKLGQKSECTQATLNRKMEVIKAILNFSTQTRRIPFYPATGFKKLKELRNDIEFWEQHQAETFLNFTNLKYPKGCPNRWIHVVYLLGLNTALRAGEIWGLQIQDIKQNAQVLHIQRQWDRVDLNFRFPKGKKSRFVPCNEEIGHELSQLITTNPNKTAKTVFSNFNGNPICHDNFVKRVFNEDISESAVKPIHFHGLRHTATTLMIANGIDIKTVQEICGHQNISTTLKYTHLLANSVKNVAQMFKVSAQSSSLG